MTEELANVLPDLAKETTLAAGYRYDEFNISNTSHWVVPIITPTGETYVGVGEFAREAALHAIKQCGGSLLLLLFMLFSFQAAASVADITNWGLSLTNAGGTITTGGTAQNALAANAKRQGFLIQNQSSADLYVNITCGTAVANQTSLRLAPNYGSYESPEKNAPLCAVSVIGAATGQAFFAAEW